MKPTGKYHFRLYILYYATTWFTVNYRFHCNRNLTARLDGVAPIDTALELRREWADAKVSSIRQLMLEVARPLFGSNRILTWITTTRQFSCRKRYDLEEFMHVVLCEAQVSIF